MATPRPGCSPYRDCPPSPGAGGFSYQLVLARNLPPTRPIDSCRSDDLPLKGGGSELTSPLEGEVAAPQQRGGGWGVAYPSTRSGLSLVPGERHPPPGTIRKGPEPFPLDRKKLRQNE